MKRDMDLIREMLLEIEANPDPMDGPSLDIGGRSRDEISYHVMLMHQAGLIDAWDCSSVDEICWYPKDLTWEGHEFLEAARDPARWQKAKDIFDVEYWELEQAKLKKGGMPPVFQGKVALVTGAASGIGRACAETLHQQGAAVIALDINPNVERIFEQDGILDLICDVTHEGDLQKSIEKGIMQFGGIDILVRLSLGDNKQILLVEVKGNGQPRMARDAVNQLIRYRNAYPEA